MSIFPFRVPIPRKLNDTLIDNASQTIERTGVSPYRVYSMLGIEEHTYYEWLELSNKLSAEGYSLDESHNVVFRETGKRVEPLNPGDEDLIAAARVYLRLGTNAKRAFDAWIVSSVEKIQASGDKTDQWTARMTLLSRVAPEYRDQKRDDSDAVALVKGLTDLISTIRTPSITVSTPPQLPERTIS